MQVSKITVDSNLKEKAKHGTSDLPLVVYTDDFKLFDEGYIKLHWHKELQFSYVLKEKIIFFIDGKEILLEPGEGIIINSNILHKIKPFKENCEMFTINFDPIIIGGNRDSLIYNKYIEPFLNTSHLKYICLNNRINWQKRTLDYIKETFDLSHQKPFLYELEMLNNINLIWITLLRELKDIVKFNKKVHSSDEERVKQAIQYIQQHYAENLTLNDIASASNISKSECCRCFQRILNMTPFEYLLEYRILQSLQLLLKSNQTISNIAHNVGFSTISYYGKIFKRYMHCTPSEYRNNQQEKIDQLKSN